MNNDNNRLRLPISIKLMDGNTITGDLIVNIGGALDRTLNNDNLFILFGDPDGSERYIAKSSISEVKSLSVATSAEQQPGTQQPAQPQAQPTHSDPYELLGITNTATDDEIREAFISRAQEYHPDRFANVALPEEVARYTNTMAQRINEAYAVLMDGKVQQISVPQAATG